MVAKAPSSASRKYNRGIVDCPFAPLTHLLAVVVGGLIDRFISSTCVRPYIFKNLKINVHTVSLKYTSVIVVPVTEPVRSVIVSE